MFNRFYALCFMISLCGCGAPTVESGDDDASTVDKGTGVTTSGLEVRSDGTVIGTAIGVSGNLLEVVTVLSPDGYVFELSTTTGKMAYRHVSSLTCQNGDQVVVNQKGYDDECSPLQHPFFHSNSGKGTLVGEYLLTDCKVFIDGEEMIGSSCMLSVEEVDLPTSYDLPITLVP